MAIQNTRLEFSVENQNLWAPGPAIDLRVDSGDLMMWNPDDVTKNFSVSALGFSIDAEFFLSARFGLLAWANLGRGGSWDADFTIDVFVDKPNAHVIGGGNSEMLFNFSNWEVVRSSISSEGFGLGDRLGAGIDLIMELDVGFRDIEFGHWFGTEDLGSFSIISLEESIELIGVSAAVPEFELELTDGVTLTARLPQGADTEGDGADADGDGRIDSQIHGDGQSDVRFLELSADLDALLVKLLDNIPLPPVKAVAKFLEEVVFAEHVFDINDYLSVVPKGKFALSFTALDISASAGLVVTEETHLDFSRIGPSDIPDVIVNLTSDFGTPDDASDDKTATGRLGDVIPIAAPTGITFGTAAIAAEFEVARAQFDHDLGLAINASIDIVALQGKLDGAWVPPFLKFKFGPILEIQIPEGGLTVDLGNIYSNGYEVDGSVFGTNEDTYDVFYVHTELTPTDWSPELNSAEAEIYGYFQAVYEQETANQATYGTAGFSVFTLNTPGGFNTAGNGRADIVVWNGFFNNSQQGMDPADRIVVDVSGISTTEGLKVATTDGSIPSSFEYIGYDESWQGRWNKTIFLEDHIRADFELNDKFLAILKEVDYVGTNFGDMLIAREGTEFIDGRGQVGGQFDVVVADFADTHYTHAVQWDLLGTKQAELAGTSDGATLFKDTGATELRIKDVEALSIRTGFRDDYVTTYLHSDTVWTNHGDDLVELAADFETDVIVLGGLQDPEVGGPWLFTDNDAVLIRFPSTSKPFSGGELFDDWVFGGYGIDHAFVQAGPLGLRYDIMTKDGAGNYSYVFGGDGIGAAATWEQFQQLSDAYYQNVQNNFSNHQTDFIDAVVTEEFEHLLLVNGGNNSGRVRLAADIEFIANHGETATGSDLGLFAGGTRYDGGGGGNDVFLADFGTYSTIFENRGGVVLNVTALSFYGDTSIENYESLYVIGTDMADRISGGERGDFIDGGAGNDVLYGGDSPFADNRVLGGDGFDTIYFDGGRFNEIDGGADFDTLIVRGDITTEGLEVAFYDGIERGAVNVGLHAAYSASSSALTLLDGLVDLEAGHAATEYNFTRIPGITQAHIARVTNVERVAVEGTPLFDDLMFYQDGEYYLGGETSGDRDTFVADFSDRLTQLRLILQDDDTTGQTLYGTFLRGIDRAVMIGSQAGDVMTGASGDDHFDGHDGNDRLAGGAGFNVLKGGAGDDTFTWLDEGYDEIDGGAGARDHLIIAGMDAGLGIAAEDANGELLFDIGAQSDLVALRQALEAPPAALYGIFGNETAVFENVEIVDAAGSDVADDLIYYVGGVAYAGGEHAGDSDIFVADFSDAQEGLFLDANSRSGVGYDIGNGVLIADFERFAVKLGSGTDDVRGHIDAIYVDAGGGDDYLKDSLGDDSLVGGAGNDVFEYSGGNDTYEGGAGLDQIAVSSETHAISFVFSSADAGLRLPVGTDAGLSYSDLGDLIDLMDGVFDNTEPPITYLPSIAINGAEVSLDGFEDFVLSGSSADDFLVAGTARGVLSGGDGDDELYGNIGADFMSGGAGEDLYVIGRDGGADVIYGEQDSDTRIVFAQGTTRAQLEYAASGRDLVVTGLGAGASLRIVDYFVQGPNGFNATFETADETFNEDLSTIGPTATAARQTAMKFTEIGTAFDEEFEIGTHRADEYRGLGGQDFFYSSPGDDLYDGGTGQDGVSYINSAEAVNVDLSLLTGTGGDAKGDILVSIENIAGSQQGDVITGDAFANTLAGVGGNDTVRGLGGNDMLTGGDGADSLIGGDGSDRLFGEDGKDTLEGGNDNDVLEGGDGDDVLEGGDGEDYLKAGAGDDTAEGGIGNDVFGYEAGRDSYAGGDGIDWVDFTEFGSAVLVGLDHALISLNEGDADFTAWTRDETDLVDGTWRAIGLFSTIENLRGGDFDDDLLGNDAANVLDGGFGNNRLTGMAGDDTFIGGDADDAVDYSRETGTQGIDLQTIATPGLGYDIEVIDTSGDTDRLIGIETIRGTDFIDVFNGALQDIDRDDRFEGRGGDDYIDGMAGDDYLDGGAGADLILGYDGNDTLIAGAGDDDTVEGEAGMDTFLGALGFGTNIYDGGTEIDTLTYFGSTEALDVDLTRVSGQIVQGTQSVDTILDIEVLLGTAQNDVFIGDSNGTIFGYTGGFDTYDGGDGADYLNFSAFEHAVLVDILDASGTHAFHRNADNVRDTDTADPLVGIATIANVFNFEGSDFDDELYGDFEENVIRGGKGDDVIDGRGGADTIHGNEGNDTFVATGTYYFTTYHGGEGFDTLDLSAIDFSTRTTFVDLGVGDLVYTGIEMVIGAVYGDDFQGDDGANIFDGNTNLDGVGGDYFLGRGGNDIFILGDHGDIDVMTGGTGLDSVDLSRWSVAGFVDLRIDVSVVDPVRRADTTDWQTATGFSNKAFSYDLLEGVIGTDHSDRIIGNALDNLFAGGEGDDSIDGLGGLDTFSWTGGLDRWNGGDDADTATFAASAFAIEVVLQDAGTSEARHRSGETLDSGTFTIAAQMTQIENLAGSVFGDRLSGNAEANMIIGFLGDDSLQGLGGADTLAGGIGKDTLIGGTGADHLSGGAGEDSLSGGDQNDTLEGGAGDDILEGGAGDTDVAAYAGNRRDFLIEATAEGFAVTHLFGSRDLEDLGTDALIDVEMIKFGNAEAQSIADLVTERPDLTALPVTLNDGETVNLATLLSTTTAAGKPVTRVEIIDSEAMPSVSVAGVGIVDASAGFIVDDASDISLVADGPSGEQKLRVRVGDEDEWSDWQSILLTSNAAPLASVADQQLAIFSGRTLSSPLDFVDPDGEKPTVTAMNGAAADVGRAVALASGAVLTLNEDGSFDYVLSEAFDTLGVGESTTDSFEYTIVDDNGKTDTATVTIQITGDYAADTGRLLVSGISAKTFDFRDLDLASLENILFSQIGADPTPGELRATFSASQFASANLRAIEGTGNGSLDFVTELVMGSALAIDLSGISMNGFAGAMDRIEIVGDGDAERISGSRIADSVSGEDGDDTLASGDGNDTASGGLGNDSIDGGAGDDLLRGNAGEDNLFGGTGEDQLRGQKNGDLLDGGDGHDNLKGGGGNDTLYGGEGRDFLNGGARKDLLDAGVGNDRLVGRSFDDTLIGGRGKDFLNAGGENDRLEGGTENDRLKGGDGADVFVFDLGMDIDRIVDFVLAEDRLEFTAALAAGRDADQIAALARQDGSAFELDLGGGNTLRLLDLASVDGLAGQIDIV